MGRSYQEPLSSANGHRSLKRERGMTNQFRDDPSSQPLNFFNELLSTHTQRVIPSGSRFWPTNWGIAADFSPVLQKNHSSGGMQTEPIYGKLSPKRVV